MENLNTSDLYKHQLELQKNLDDLVAEIADLKEDGSAKDLLEAEWSLLDWKNYHFQELKELDDLEAKVGSSWMHGVTLIPEHDFTEYTKELAKENEINLNVSWPFNCIDWDKVAENLRFSYTGAEYQGITYYFQ